MATNWTQAQQQAIKQTGSVLVSASAGTGKTAVLTEKVVNSIVNEGINIDDMVIMTFSNAAAAQMKERIKNRIRDIINSPDTDRSTKNLLYKQLRRFNNAHIQTIHSFCGELIKKYFYIVGVEPNVRVADTFDVAIIKRKVVDEVLAPEYDAIEPDFVSLEELIDGTEDIETVVINTYDKIISFIDHMNWLKSAIEKYNIGDSIPSFITESVLGDFEAALKDYNAAIELLESEEKDLKIQKILDVFYEDRTLLEQVIAGIKAGDKKYYTELQKILEPFGATVRFPSGSIDLDDAKKMRNNARDIITSNYVKTNFDVKAQCDRIKAMYPVLCKFYKIMERFNRRYTEEKRNRRIIDFNDMEKLACKILEDESISQECKSNYLRVFIDEYQDTNPIQELIISRISTDNNLFCVGDLKQSIYRFRSSDPMLFAQRSRNYSANVNLGTIINLNNNFRSAQNILDCSNDVFDYITRASSEISYTKNDALIHGRQDDKSITAVEVNIIPEDLRGTDNLTMEEIEVYNIVKIIKDNIGKPIYDPELGQTRPTEFKDIVVLSRKLSSMTDYLAQILTANNIPFVIERTGELLETMEIQTILNIISLVNNPKNDMALISVMHLGLFDFTDDDILAVKNKDKGSYYAYMSTADDETTLAVKCRKLFSFLDGCREKQKYLPLTTTLDYMIGELKLGDTFAIMRNGRQRVANIKEFMKYAHDFENKYGEKLFGFEQYIKNIKEAGISVGEAVVSYDDNSVRITTIHKSKGLEYPVVILAFTGKEFNKMDRRANVVIDKDTGIGVKYYSHDKKERGKCMLRTFIEDSVDEKNREEEMRLLYVAMTRAKEKLYIQGTSKPDQKDYAVLRDAKCFLDWVMATIANSVEYSNDYNGWSEIRLSGKWEVNIVDYADLRGYLASEAEEADLNEVLKRFSLPSEISESEQSSEKEYIPLVMSASSGIKKKEVSAAALSKPDFMRQGEDAKYVGTVVHEFLRHADLKKCSTETGISLQKDIMQNEGVMDGEDLKYVDAYKLFLFFQSALGQDILSADEYIKEKYIGIVKNASDVGYSQDEDILVRCIIDLIYKKDGKYYLVDYKTDHIFHTDDEAEVRMRAYGHKPQLDMYREALKSMYDIEIERAYVAFVNYGVYYDVTQ